MTGWFIFDVGLDINRINNQKPEDIEDFISINIVENQLSEKLFRVRSAANSLVVLGLMGTVIGMILAFQNVSEDSVSSVESLKPLVGFLLSGIGTALYTTLVGAIFSFWLERNIIILNRSGVDLVNAHLSNGNGLPTS